MLLPEPNPMKFCLILIRLSADATTTVTDELTYAKLKEGLIINGNPLPEDELDIAIGSGWQFRFVGKAS
jgi:hypothetical protein